MFLNSLVFISALMFNDEMTITQFLSILVDEMINKTE